MHLAKKWQNSDGNKKKADFYITYWQPLTFFCIFFISHKRFEKQLPTFDLHGKKKTKVIYFIVTAHYRNDNYYQIKIKNAFLWKQLSL